MAVDLILSDVLLTLAMQEALLMIGFGVSGCVDGFYSLDDPDKRLDLRSVVALARRGLVWYYTTGASPMRGCWGLTSEGDDIFEQIRELQTKRCYYGR